MSTMNELTSAKLDIVNNRGVGLMDTARRRVQTIGVFYCKLYIAMRAATLTRGVAMAIERRNSGENYLSSSCKLCYHACIQVDYPQHLALAAISDHPAIFLTTAPLLQHCCSCFSI